MKYAVVGAGAIGAVLGAFPAMGGQEVWFIDPFKAHMDAIKENGLIMQTCTWADPTNIKEVVAKVNTTTDADDVGKVDVAILMVKGIFTESAIPNLKKICDENTIIVSFQNGMGNLDILKEHFNPDNLAYGVTLIASSMVKPGVVKPALPADKYVHIGSDNKALKPRLEQIVAEFNAGGCDMDYDDDILDKVWAKLVVNCVNALPAIVHLNAKRACSYEDYIHLVSNIRKELIAVGTAMGAKMDPNAVNMKAIPYEVSPIAAVFPSTSQDIRAKKATENEFLSGYIVKQGEKLGIPTPYNDALYRLVKTIEQSYEYQE